MSATAEPASQRRAGIRDALRQSGESVKEWIAERAGNYDLFDESNVAQQRYNPWFLLGPMQYLFWLVILVTGFYLVIFYVPTPYRAYDTVNDIQTLVPLGWLVRGMHKYGADAFLIASTMRVYRMYFTAELRRPKEFVYMTSVGLLVFGMFSGLTGYLLIWNQRAFWATKVFATFPTYLADPFTSTFLHIPDFQIGRTMSEVMLGGASLGPATLTRFYAGHYALSLILMIFVECHFQRMNARRLNMGRFSVGLFLVMLALMSAILPATMGSRSDPFQTPERMFSDWYFLGLYHMYRLQDPFWATIITVVIPVGAIAVAFFDRGGSRRVLDRPMTFTFGMLAMFYWLLFSHLLITNHADIHKDPTWIMTLAGIICVVGMVWQLVHSARKGQIRPFPDMLDGVAITWLMTAFIQFLHFGYGAGILKVYNPKGWPSPTFFSAPAGPIDWWSDKVNTQMLIIIGGTALILFVFGTLRDLPERWAARKIEPKDDPVAPVTVGVDRRYALFYLAFFFVLMYVGAFGLIS
ncbi:MAG: cytochrome b N-terminal domain-containing protein [Chloroflexi bacterium]|nr:cytochrome b N-terminal domain-containing protein [Chloroflexota bacterium]